MRTKRRLIGPSRAASQLTGHNLARLGPTVSASLGLGCLMLLGSGMSIADGHLEHLKNRHAGIHDARAQHRLVGLDDQQMSMFASPLWQQLRTRVVRYVAPYDAAVRRGSRARATAWIEAAEAQHQQILVAFYHSQYAPTKLPSVRLYQKDVRSFHKLFPRVRLYQPWDEANRGTVRGRSRAPQRRPPPASTKPSDERVQRACSPG